MANAVVHSHEAGTTTDGSFNASLTAAKSSATASRLARRREREPGGVSHTGTVSLFERAGFEPVRIVKHSYVLMRRHVEPS